VTPSIFSIVPDGAVRRRPSDLVRVVLAVVVIAVTGLLAANDFTDLENDVYDFFTAAPSSLEWLFRAGYWSLPAMVAAVLVGAIVGRHVRMVVTIALASATTAIAGFALDAAIGTKSSESLADAGADLTKGAPEYPPIAFAVAAAAVLAASPYLTRPTRRFARTLVLVSAACAIILVEGLPAAVVGAIALAWGLAAATQFALGTPAGTPALSEVRSALDDLGLSVTDLSLADDQTWGEARFVGTLDGDRVVVDVLGRDAIDAGVYAKLLRSVLYKDSGPSVILSREQQVEHRAYLSLLADRAGVQVPEVIAAGTAGDLGHALLVSDALDGRLLSTVDASELTDAVLDDAWQNIERLHGARLAHGNLYLGHVALLDDGTTLLGDLSSTEASASPERQSLDRAELLVSTAAVIGVDRAVDAMARALDHDQIEAALPLMQTSAMSHQVRHAVPKPKALIGELRTRAAARIGVPEPQLTELRRVSPANLAMAIGAALGVYLLLGELSDAKSVGDIFRDPDWWWVGATALVSQTPQIAQAIAMLGSVSAKLPLGPAIGVQFANQFMGLVGGTVATTALVIRWFQKQGLAVAVAISSGVLNTAAGMVTEAVLVTIGLIASRGDFDVSRNGSSSGGGSGGSLAALVIIFVVALAGAALVVPRFRKHIGAKLKPQFVAARDNLHELRGRPRKAIQLFAGNVVSQMLFALTLEFALQAYGYSLPIMELVVINSFASLLGGIAPIPGGMGVIEAGLIAGFTAAGVPQTTAISATFTARLFTAYLPPIWGWMSLQWLRRRDYV
jgi:uncharacterized membrane protein YbhN (UPF0104 family)/tRNA A-37 threonylcarbamoyl transferase component Bud32